MLEIVDSAIADWSIKLVDTIADNASGGGFVLGCGPRDVGGIVLSGALGPMVPAEPGDVFAVEMQGFPTLHLGFSK